MSGIWAPWPLSGSVSIQSGQIGIHILHSGAVGSGMYTGMIIACGSISSGSIGLWPEELPEVKIRLEKLAAAKTEKEKELIKALIQKPKDANVRGMLHDVLFESGREKEAREVLYRKW